MFANDIGLTIIVVTLLILLLIAVVVITIFVSNKRHAQQETQMAKMQLDYEKELRSTEQEVQEQVLVNVARELHDNIGQLLTVMSMQLEQQKFINPTMAEPLQSISNTLASTTQEVRRLGKSLNSDLLEANGLIHSMEQEVARLQQLKKYNVTWEHHAEPRLSKDQRVIIFRMFQEMLNNIMKHSAAKNITVKVGSGDLFKLTVSDDGKGFDTTEMIKSPKGSGLKNMNKRAEMAKLKLGISSEINKGTMFTLEQIA
jgi:signal transduction histidine kinase